MTPDLFPFKDYLQGKPIYAIARRALSFLFSVSISSYLFEKFYFQYTWLDFTGYKAILDFLIKGYFFVPFSLFVIVHYALDWGSRLLYNTLITLGSSKFQAHIMAYTFKKSDTKDILKAIKRNPVLSAADEPWFLALYQHLSASVTPRQWQKSLASLNQKKEDNEKSFQLAFKALVTISIYFSSVLFFGWILYLLVMIVLLAILVTLYIGYMMMEIFPAAIQQMHQEVSAYIEKRQTQVQPAHEN